MAQGKAPLRETSHVWELDIALPIAGLSSMPGRHMLPMQANADPIPAMSLSWTFYSPRSAAVPDIPIARRNRAGQAGAGEGWTPLFNKIRVRVATHGKGQAGQARHGWDGMDGLANCAAQ